jgi:hypothetical protein
VYQEGGEVSINVTLTSSESAFHEVGDLFLQLIYGHLAFLDTTRHRCIPLLTVLQTLHSLKLFPIPLPERGLKLEDSDLETLILLP